MAKRMLIKHKELPGEAPREPELAFPVIGKWYHGVTQRGAGALVKYEGWGEFCDSDGKVIPMGDYDHLVEH